MLPNNWEYMNGFYYAIFHTERSDFYRYKRTSG